jgi:diguanylate cyclase (GGDEF)-like protein
MSSKRRTIRFFIATQILIVAIFSFITYSTLEQLGSLGKQIQVLSEESVPKIALASSLNNQIQNLATLTTILSNSQTNPARAQALFKTNNLLTLIDTSLRADSAESLFIVKQLATLTAEIDELDNLVEQRIRQEGHLSDAQDALNALFYRLFLHLESLNTTDKIDSDIQQLVLNSNEVYQQNRMHKLRQIEEGLRGTLNQIKSKIASDRTKTHEYIDQIAYLLVSEEGIVHQKIASLRITGRARGRDNFVRNLIAGVASNLQYQTLLVNQETLKNAVSANEAAEQQKQFTVAASVFAMFVSASIIYFLYKQIVFRLVSLSEQVEQATEDKCSSVAISGNDEIASLANSFSMYLQKVRDQEDKLLELSLTDSLTGIPNRRAFDDKLSHTLALCKRNIWSVSIMLLDVDFFKLFNDSFGHIQGDKCLVKVAKTLEQTLSRGSDFCARYGGEEFVCVLPDTDLDGAMKKAEELRFAVEKLGIKHPTSEVSKLVTVSIGVVSFPAESLEKWENKNLFEYADRELYKAKNNGRNRCEAIEFG